jgi:hypothetical protein
MTKAGMCGLTIFHRLTAFGFKKLLKKWSDDEKSSDHISLDCQKIVKQGIAENQIVSRLDFIVDKKVI